MKKSKTKLVAIFFAATILVGSLATIFPAKTVSAATTCPATPTHGNQDAAGCDVEEIIVNLNLTANGANLDLSGDQVVQAGNEYDITNNSVNQYLYKLPDKLQITVGDNNTGYLLPDRVPDPAKSGYYKQTSNNTSSGPVTKTFANSGASEDTVQYIVYVDPNDNQSKNASYNYDICVQAADATATGFHKICKANVTLNTMRGLANENQPASSIPSISLSEAYIPQSLPAGYQPATPPTISGGNTNQQSEPTCETSGSPLTWILCPVFNGVSAVATWLLRDVVQPFLITTPVSTNPQDKSFQVWSEFRVYGDIVLVIALLAVVISEVIGGGLIDAYTVKKMLPRILLAAILINLSVYIVAALVDITNIVGGSISNIIVEPFKQSGLLNFSLNGSQQIGAFAIGILGLVAGAGGLSGVLGAVVLGAGIALPAIGFVLLMAAIPILLSIFAVFATLVIRQGIILFLIISSPVAFALYCLPNLEHIFKRWWKLLMEALLVYPIVMIIFAVSSVMSATILAANDTHIENHSLIINGLQDAIAAFIAFALQFLPLFAAPFAFRIAGGTLGKLHEMVSGSAKRVGQMEGIKQRTQAERNKLRALTLAARGRQYNALNDITSRAGVGRGRKAVAGFLRNRVGGYNLPAALAELNTERFKQMEAQKDAGDDTEQRALTVNKAAAYAADRMALDAGRDGEHMRIRDGRYQYRTLGGRWVDESAVDAAHQRWNGDQAALQWALGYEMQKATTDEEQEYLYNNYSRMQQSGSGFNLSDREMGNLWTGAAFAKQNSDRQWKHYRWDNGVLRADGRALMREIDERQGNYAQSLQHAETWKTMREEYQRAQETLNNPAIMANPAGNAEQIEYAQEVMRRSERIAAQYATERYTGGMAGPAGVNNAGEPIFIQQQAAGANLPAGQREREWVVSQTGAAAHAQEEMANFVTTVLPNVNFERAPGYNPAPPSNPTRDNGGRPGTYS